MTSTGKPARPWRRHPLAVLAALLLTAAALWIGYFLATFDLNHYREELSRTVAERLQMPVRLGDAHLELREGGVAFRFAEVQIGTAETAAELRAKQLWLQLAWYGLLFRQPILTEIALDAPLVRISPPAADTAEDDQPQAPFDLQQLAGLQIHRVEIQQGTLVLNWRNRSGSLQTVELTDLSVEADGVGLAGNTTFNITGNLAGRALPTRLALRGSVALPAQGPLLDAEWDLALEARALDLAPFAGLLQDAAGMQAQGTADLELFLRGVPPQGANFQVEVTGSELQLRPRPDSSQPLPLRHLQVVGTWQRQEGGHDFRQVAVQLNDLRMAGELSLVSGGDGRQINGALHNSTLPLDTLRPWVPPAILAANPLLSRRIPGGTLFVNEARFHAEIPNDPQGFAGFSLDEMRGELRNVSWDLGRGRRAELQSLQLRLEGQHWYLEHGTGALAGLPATAQATIALQSDGQPRFSLDLAISGPTGAFAALNDKPLPEGLNLAGTLSLKGQVEGTPDAYRLALHADLTQLDVRYGQNLHVPPTPEAFLAVRGTGSRSALSIEQGEMLLGKLAGRLTGTLEWAEVPAADFAVRLELADLAAAYPYAPALEKLRLLGGVTLELAAQGPLAELQSKITLDLIDVGIPTHGIVADISQLNGRLHLEEGGIRSEKLTARLGKSLVNLTGRVADFGEPRLVLDVQAPLVRADEVVFNSDRVFLRDIEGRLVFDREGLAFAPVKVRLDRGTRATVSGSVKDFADPRVVLDISGDYANIEEIIGLWTNQTAAAAAARRARHAGAPHKPLPPIRIEVEARQGDLYGMKFANARALIVPSTDRLLIHPLDFNIDKGYCNAQVLVDFRGEHSVLRVSGHAEDVDAYQVHNELLDRKSILRGTLRGDFYLQGELGEGRFLPTSFGNFTVSVRDGVMRHSPVLATIFSLLNVSQLFTLQLPDVDLEGVPFSLMTAELAIDQGVLSSENVRVDSQAMNMTYVGQYNMVRNLLDLLVVVKPLGTVDKVVTSLPIAGWLLGGEEKALITAQFKVTGPAGDPDVEAIPISAISKGVLGIVQRALGLPLKLIEDPAILWGGGGEKR